MAEWWEEWSEVVHEVWYWTEVTRGVKGADATEQQWADGSLEQTDGDESSAFRSGEDTHLLVDGTHFVDGADEGGRAQIHAVLLADGVDLVVSGHHGVLEP